MSGVIFKQREFDDGDIVYLDLLYQGKWEEMCSGQDTTMEVFEHISLMTLDMLMQCAFSQETNCQLNRLAKGREIE